MKNKLKHYFEQNRSKFWPLTYLIFYAVFFLMLERHVTVNYTEVSCRLDSWIPFCEYFFYPYAMWAFYLASVYLYFASRPWTEHRRYCINIMAGTTLCLIICALFPNGQNLRVEVDSGKNLASFMIGLLHTIDTNTNTFPSIHVFTSMASALSLHTSLGLGRHRRRVLICSDIAAALISCSTVLIKQHSVLDAAASLLLAAFMYWIVYIRPQVSEKTIPA